MNEPLTLGDFILITSLFSVVQFAVPFLFLVILGRRALGRIDTYTGTREKPR